MIRHSVHRALLTAALAWAPGSAAPARLDESLGFVRNVGQAPAAADFVVSEPGTSLALLRDRVALSLPGRDSAGRPAPETVALRFLGADPAARPRGESPLDTHTGYFAGSDPSKWIKDAPTFGRVRYRGVYPGTDLLCYGRGGRLEYDWILAPGADPSRIRLALDGVLELRVDAAGDLVARTARGEVRQAAPVAYQVVAGERRPVRARFHIGRDRQVGFRLGAYDRGRELVIDPTLDWSNTYATGSAPNYTGGTFEIYGNGAMAVDASTGDVIIAWTDYSEPIGGGSYSTYLHVKRVQHDGSATGGNTFSSTFGGAAFHDDQVRAMTVDGSGNAYMAGVTNDTSFPVTTGSLSGYTPFVLKVDTTGSLVYSFLFAGGTGSSVSGIAVNGSGSAFVCGSTTSTSFPTTTGCFQPAHADDQTKNASEGGSGYGNDGWIARVSVGGGLLVFATYLGGDDQDTPTSIAFDTANNVVYVAGTTQSAGMGTSGAYQQAHGSDAYDPGDGSSVNSGDGFIARFNASLSTRTWFSYLGGNSTDTLQGLALDSSGNPCAVLTTYSGDMPHSSGAYQTTHASDGGSNDAYVAKLSSDGASLLTGTYFGGTGDEEMDHLALDDQGNFIVSGTTAMYIGGSNSLPKVNNLYNYDDVNGSPFMARITGDGRYVAFSSSLSSSTSYGSGSPLPGGTQSLLGLAWGGTYKQAYVTGTSGSFNNVALKSAAFGLNSAPDLAAGTLGSTQQGGSLTVAYADLVSATHASDPDGEAFSFVVQSVDSGSLTKSGVAVTPGATTLVSGEQWVWTPAASAHGASVNAFTLSATDSVHASSTVQVSATVNGQPTLSAVSNQTVEAGASGPSVSFTVSDAETAAGSLGVTASSSYATLIPNANLSLNHTGGSYTLGITPAAQEVGSATITLTVTDADGGTTTGTFDVTVQDTTGPSPSASVSGARGTITLSATATDYMGTDHVDFYVDGSSVGTGSSGPTFSTTCDSTLLSDGSHTLLAKAYDAQGNLGTSSVGFSVDNTAPSKMSVASSGTHGTIVLTARAYDHGGLDHVQFLVDGNDAGSVAVGYPYVLNFDSTSVGDGLHTLAAKAFDTAGNSAQVAGPNFRVSNTDANPPTVTAVSVKGTTGTIALHALASDDLGVARVGLYVDGSLLGYDTTTPYDSSFDSTTLTDGTHTFTATAYDYAGNSGSASVSFYVTNHDATPPTVTASVQGNVGTVFLVATASDNTGVTKVGFSVDGNLLGYDTTSPYRSSFDSATLTDGPHTFTATAYDYAGNQSTATTTFYAANHDAAAPTVSVSVQGYANTIYLRANASDDVGVAYVELYVDGSLLGKDPTAPYATSFDSHTLTNGPHTFSAIAYDYAGRHSATANTIFVTNN